mgnify:CR=1 FL=1
MANHKKDIRDSRITFTINPSIEKKVREKVKSLDKTLSGVIVSLLEGWLSDESIHTDTNRAPQSVDIEQLKKEILAELRNGISTPEKKGKEQQSVLVHTDTNQFIEAPTSTEVIESHAFIPLEREPATSNRYEAVKMGKPSQSEREELCNSIKRFKEEFRPVIDTYRIEHELKDARKAMKALFGFTDSEVSQMTKSDYSLTRSKLNEYYTMIAEARQKFNKTE